MGCYWVISNPSVPRVCQIFSTMFHSTSQLITFLSGGSVGCRTKQHWNSGLYIRITNHWGSHCVFYNDVCWTLQANDILLVEVFVILYWIFGGFFPPSSELKGMWSKQTKKWLRLISKAIQNKEEWRIPSWNIVFRFRDVYAFVWCKWEKWWCHK